MAVMLDATMPRNFSGQTGKEIVAGFINLRTSGAREVAKKLELMAIRAGQDPGKLMDKAVRKASEIIKKGYKDKIRNATGNLGKSMTTQIRAYEGARVAITGPRVTGPVGADPERGSGNHAWLVEFGTARRKPGTQGRRTYVNVHQSINGRMKKVGGFNNEQFENMGRGYYFLMGSKNEKTRQAKAGSGYPHDFVPDGKGGTKPYFLRPGETYGAMPAQHPMERTITENSSAVLGSLIANMQTYIDELSK
jgi:hypothetical protein